MPPWSGRQMTSFLSQSKPRNTHLGKRLFHSGNRIVLHVRQDMAIGVERYRYGRVPQHFRDDLWVHVLEWGCCSSPGRLFQAFRY